MSQGRALRCVAVRLARLRVVWCGGSRMMTGVTSSCCCRGDLLLRQHIELRLVECRVDALFEYLESECIDILKILACDRCRYE
jgi:hypothetical protein